MKQISKPVCISAIISSVSCKLFIGAIYFTNVVEKSGICSMSSNFRGQLKKRNVLPTLSNMCNIVNNSAVVLNHFHIKKILTAFNAMSGGVSYIFVVYSFMGWPGVA